MSQSVFIFFFFNDTATTEIYTLSLHDALPICIAEADLFGFSLGGLVACAIALGAPARAGKLIVARSEEHTSELQSQSNLVCRLLLEKKKKRIKNKNLINRERCVELTITYVHQS